MLLKCNFFFLIILLINENCKAEKVNSGYLQTCQLTTNHGPQMLRIDNESRPFKVFCEQNIYGGGWTTILNRFDGSLNFSQRTCEDFKFGFGDINNEFFLGLDQLSALTNLKNHMLLVLMTDFNGTEYAATYDAFIIWDETFEYSTGISATNNLGVDAGFTKWNAFCTACSKLRCMNDIPGWQLNPYLEPKIATQSVIQFFGTYPKSSSDAGRSKMGVYFLQAKKLLPLKSLKMLIRPFKEPSSFKGHSKDKAQLDKRFLPLE